MENQKFIVGNVRTKITSPGDRTLADTQMMGRSNSERVYDHNNKWRQGKESDINTVRRTESVGVSTSNTKNSVGDITPTNNYQPPRKAYQLKRKTKIKAESTINTSSPNISSSSKKRTIRLLLASDKSNIKQESSSSSSSDDNSSQKPTIIDDDISRDDLHMFISTKQFRNIKKTKGCKKSKKPHRINVFKTLFSAIV